MHREATAVVSTVLPLLMVLLRASGAAAGCDPSTDPDHADMANALAVSLVAVAAHATTDPLTRCCGGRDEGNREETTSKFKCYATAAEHKTAVDPGCLAKAESKCDEARRGPAPPPRADPAAIWWAH